MRSVFALCLCALLLPSSAQAADDATSALKAALKRGRAAEIVLAIRVVTAEHNHATEARTRKKAMTALIAAATGRNLKPVRKAAIQALGRVNDPDAAWRGLKRLLPAVFHKTADEFAMEAIASTGRAAPAAAWGALKKLAERAKAMPVARAAIQAVGQYGVKRERKTCLAFLLRHMAALEDARAKKSDDLRAKACLPVVEETLVALVGGSVTREQLLTFAREADGVERLLRLPPEAQSPLHAEGRRALEKGDPKAALVHLERALALDPSSWAVHADRLLAVINGPDRREQALEQAVRACADSAGAFDAPTYWPEVPADEVARAALRAEERSAARKRLVAVAEELKSPADGPLLRLIERAWRRLGIGTREAEAAPPFRAARHACAPDQDLVMRSLVELLEQHEQAGKMDDAFDVAHAIVSIEQQRHLADQAEWSSAGRDASTKALRRNRKALAPLPGAQYDRKKLAALAQRAHEIWDKRHGRLSKPAVGVTAAGRYRVESTCGYETLASALRYLDAHHARLADWMGSDPFKGKPGEVRMHPTPAEMEGERTQRWWAQGFQRGDLTIAMVRWSTHMALARLLTHEITHRFDGVLLPGMPTWLSEGRAVYTQICMSAPDAAKVDERALDWDYLEKALNLGYSYPRRMAELIAGKPRDPRHNYAVGYSLFTFLRRYGGDGKTPLFRERLDAYEKSFRDGGAADPVGAFEDAFCDGEGGRPKGLSAFCEQFQQFLRAFILPKEKQPVWTRKWIKAARAVSSMVAYSKPNRTLIADPLTRGVARRRLDDVPPGEEHAYFAASLLEAAGRHDAATHAYAWALQTDEPFRERWQRAAAHHESQQQTAAAFATRKVMALLFDDVTPPKASAETPLAAAAQALTPMIARLRDDAGAAATATRPGLAAQLQAEHDELCRLVGMPPQPMPKAASVSALWRSLLLPDLGETYWSRVQNEFEDRWRVDPGSGLTLGFHKDQTERTGAGDRGIRRIYVESPTWIEGVYTLRTRVTLHSEFTRAFMTIGATRRDRGVEIQFKGNDPVHELYRKKKKLPPPFKSVRLRVRDFRAPVYERLGRFRTFRFEDPRTWFDLEVEVYRSRMVVRINGKRLGTFRRVTGAAVEGRIGFGLEVGYVTYLHPEILWHPAAGDGSKALSGLTDLPATLAKAPALLPEVGTRLQGVTQRGRPALVVLFHNQLYKGIRSPNAIRDEAARIRQFLTKYRLPVDLVFAGPPADVKPADGEPINMQDKRLRPHVTRTLLHGWGPFFQAELARRDVDGKRKLTYAPTCLIVGADGEVLFAKSTVPYEPLRWFFGQ